MNKYIEEMAWDLCDIPKHPSIKSCEQCGNKHCLAMYYAKRACNNGYRKASDVAREIFEEVMQASESGVADAEGTVNRSTKRFAFREVLLHTGRMYSGHIGKAICEVFKRYESEGAKDEVSREG